jgi:hypothetical protein
MNNRMESFGDGAKWTCHDASRVAKHARHFERDERFVLGHEDRMTRQAYAAHKRPQPLVE